MGRIDTIGTYRGDIIDASLSTTKRGFPQFAACLRATEKYVDDAEGMSHFGIEEPGWVDWTEFNEEILAYLVLFNDAEEFTEDTSLMNYEQLRLALGWSGDEFDSLVDGTHINKSIQFRVGENEWNGKISLCVEWVDAADAPPTRELRKLDGDKLKDLSSKLKIRKRKPAAKPAKPAAKPAAKSEESPAPKPAPKSEEPPAAKPEAPSGLPATMSQAAAWEFVCVNMGDNSDSDVEDAWIAACTEVGGDRDEDDFTETDWAKVRDLVIGKLSLNV